MACSTIKIGGGAAIVCTRTRRRKCFACFLTAGFRCDWKMRDGGTCDRFICVDHAQEVAPGKHLCPEHQQAYKAWLADRERASA